jgi:cellobiose phosphorylase
LYTPYPWINYLGNKDYFALFSNTSGGYSFFKDARQRRITRFRYNNVPVDNEGKYFFIKDGDTIFNIGGRPLKRTLDSYHCRHGLGYSVIESSKNQLFVKQTSFVPLDGNCEIHRLELTNNDEDIKAVNIISYLEWCLFDAYDDMTNFQRNYSIGEVEVEGSTIYHKTEYRERRNHYAFYHVNQPISGFDTDRDAFVGLYTDSALTQAFTLTAMPSNHIKLYAKWS